MRKNYLYAVTILLLLLGLGLSCFFFREYKPAEYKNGTFVECPMEFVKKDRELTA